MGLLVKPAPRWCARIAVAYGENGSIIRKLPLDLRNGNSLLWLLGPDPTMDGVAVNAFRL